MWRSIAPLIYTILLYSISLASEATLFISENFSPSPDALKRLIHEASLEEIKDLKLGTKFFKFNKDKWEQAWGPIANNALLFRLTREDRYLRNARSCMMSICSYSKWGNPDQPSVDIGLNAALPLIQLSLGYNWLKKYLPPNELALIREKCTTHAERLLKGILSKKPITWSENKIHPAPVTRLFALYLAARCLEKDTPVKARQWLSLSTQKIHATFSAISTISDGSLPMDLAHGSLFSQSLLLFWETERQLTSKKDFLKSSWMSRHGDWIMANVLPDNQAILMKGDHYGKALAGPEHLLYLLSTWYNHGQAAYVADAIQKERWNQREKSHPWRFLNVLFSNPGVKRIKPESLKIREFKDWGVVTIHQREPFDQHYLSFTCGDYSSATFSQNIRAGLPGLRFEFTHPDQGSFTWMVNNRHIITDSGKDTHRKTFNHSTLLIDGNGQIAEKSNLTSMDLALNPRKVKWAGTRVQDNMIIARGDLSAAYPESTGLESFDRTLVWLAPRVLLIIDHITCDKAHRLDLIFRSLDYALSEKPKGFYQNATGMQLYSSSFPEAKWSTGVTLQKHLAKKNFYAKSSTHAREWTHVAVIAPTDYAQDLTCKQNKDDLYIMFAAWKYEFIWKKNIKDTWLSFSSNGKKKWALRSKL